MPLVRPLSGKITVRLDSVLAMKLEKYCDDCHGEPSAVVRQALAEFLGRHAIFISVDKEGLVIKAH